jgi:hypothetical protein
LGYILSNILQCKPIYTDGERLVRRFIINQNTKVVIIEKGKETIKGLWSLNAHIVLSELFITFDHVALCFTKYLKLIAGSTLFCDNNSIKHQGCSLGLVAGKDVIFEPNTKIDLSGLDVLPFKYGKGYSFTEAHTEKVCEGDAGCDGFSGFSGGNGGNLLLQCDRTVINLDKLNIINCCGGKGSDGQMGGNGQQGGPGKDTNDASLDMPATRLFEPYFAIAFSRIPGSDPGLDPTDPNYFTKDPLKEKSGKGGNAGKAGRGGVGGNHGTVVIKCASTYHEIIEELRRSKKIINENGSKGSNGKIDSEDAGKGGDPGK